jgi:predicted transcriptional regulator
MNRFQEIEKICSQKGVSLSEVCRQLDIPYSTIYQWKYRSPKAFDYETKIKQHLKTLKK